MKKIIIEAINEVLEKLDVQAKVEVNNSLGHGDLSSNICFKLVDKLNLSPKAIGEKIINLIDKSKFNIKKVEFAAPGFLNFYLNNLQKNNILKKILIKKDDFGRGNVKKYVNVEFVSANPTGYLHVGHSRGAAYGDTLSNILEFSGMKVDREYYVNDAGMQIKDLGTTTFYRYKELFGKKIDLSTLSYIGNEIIETAKIIKDKIGDKYKESELTDEINTFFSNEAKVILLDKIKEHLAKFNVVIPRYYSEESSYENNQIEKIMAKVDKHIIEEDGALWLNTTAFGDDKNRVLKKSDGTYTYFAPDFVFHNIKAARGYDLLIDVLGGDHISYVDRMKIAMEISGYPDILKVPIVQMVHLMKDGKEVVMSKRKGTAYTLIQLINEVGTDSARFSLTSRTLDSKMHFDINKAKSKSGDNPVIYVQYAYARARQLLLKANYTFDPSLDLKSDVLNSEKEQLILDELWKFEELILTISSNFRIHLLNTYIFNLSKLFHSFYNNSQVIGSNDETAKLWLVDATSQIIKNGLKLLGIKTIERMNYER